MESLLQVMAATAAFLILGAMAIAYGVDSRDGFGGERTPRRRI